MALLQGILPELKNVTPTPPVSTDIAGQLTEEVTTVGSTWDSFLQLIGLVFLLIIILVAAYFTSRFVGGIKLGQMKNSNFEVIDSYRVSQNKVIQIVKIANKYIVIGIGKDTINFITELEEADVLIKEVKAGEMISFKQTLDKLRKVNK